MGRADTPRIHAAQIETYLARRGHRDARIIATKALGETEGDEVKGYGYGKPLRVTFVASGKTQTVVLRTMSTDPFGHDRRADRVDAMVLAFDTFNAFPRHIRALDVGIVDPEGQLISMPRGEPFLVTDYVDGDLYAKDLFALGKKERAEEGDLIRTRALARFLAALHAQKAEPARYRRALRDTVASGEGIFGQCDGYPKDNPVAPPSRLAAIEQAVLPWRWKLRELDHRACRTHGDFHPFNILFRSDEDLSVLDHSRGGAGDAADDVTCLAVNYVFFSFLERGELTDAYRTLFTEFFATYLSDRPDNELYDVVAPFFTWRLLVLANPLWYPNLPNPLRDRLLRMAERLLAGASFHPSRIDELLA